MGDNTKSKIHTSYFYIYESFKIKVITVFFKHDRKYPLNITFLHTHIGEI